MGPFIYFYLKTEAYSYTGEAEKRKGGLFGRHIPTMSYIGSYPPPHEIKISLFLLVNCRKKLFVWDND